VDENLKQLEEQLNLIRAEIDQVDEKIKSLLIERFMLIDKIIEIKKTLNIEHIDLIRESNIYQMILRDLPPDITSQIKNIFERIIEVSRDYQKKRFSHK
jgi:chorismate mutase